MTMKPLLDLQLGDRIVTLMAALVLVLQIAMVAQRWIVTHIRIFAAQSCFLAMIAATIAWFNHAPHIYIAAALTLVVKVILVPRRGHAERSPLVPPVPSSAGTTPSAVFAAARRHLPFGNRHSAFANPTVPNPSRYHFPLPKCAMLRLN